MRTSIYIDGFNFYYLNVRRTSYKWLDFRSLATSLLQPHHSIQTIKYFTSIVSGIQDPGQPVRQRTYIEALQAYLPELSVYYGEFLTHNKWMPLVNPQGRNRFAQVIKTEEKGSDVNLAVHLVNDGWRDEYDCAVIFSNDGDLEEAVRIVKEELNKVVGIVIPMRGHPSNALLRHSTFAKRIRRGILRSSQLPNPIPSTNMHKPESW